MDGGRRCPDGGRRCPDGGAPSPCSPTASPGRTAARACSWRRASSCPSSPSSAPPTRSRRRTCASPLVLCRSSGGGQSGGRIYVGGGGRIHRSSGWWPRTGARRARPGGSGHGGHDISTLPGLDIFVTMADGYNAGNTKDGEPRATWMADGTQWAGTWVEPAEDHRKGDHAGMVLLGGRMWSLGEEKKKRVWVPNHCEDWMS